MSRTIEEVQNNRKGFEVFLENAVNNFANQNGVRVSVDIKEIPSTTIGSTEYNYTCHVEVKL